MNADILKSIKSVQKAVSTFVVSQEGQEARKRPAKNPTSSELVGGDGITRTIVSAPLGAFWEIPKDLAVRVTKALSARKEEKAGNYVQFTLKERIFEIGACSLNKITSEFEIWFAPAGKLGQTSNLTTDELISALDKQVVDRKVQEVDTEDLTSAVMSTEEALKLVNEMPKATDEEELPF